MTIDELGEHVNINSETKKQAIEQEIELRGKDVYDRNYLIQNVGFCPNCCKVSHFKDWDSDSREMTTFTKVAKGYRTTVINHIQPVTSRLEDLGVKL
jgi:hypothetical protein